MTGKRLLLFWILIGLLCRLIFMPFTLHPDILRIYYYPYFLASKGVWNIYSYHADFFKEHRYHYYAPLTYIFFGGYLFLAKPFLSGFDSFIEGIHNVNEQGGGHSGHFLTAISSDKLFRFLFLMKLPYLFFDIAILGLMVSFITPLCSTGICDGEKRVNLMKWWALNPLFIYVCYLFGQFDIIPTFLIVFAAYLAFKKKKVLAMISLGSGVVFKSFPLFLIFPFSFCFGKDVKGIIKYMFIAAIPLFIIIAPYYFLSEGRVMGAFFSERIAHRLGFRDLGGTIRFLIFTFGYLVLCFSLLKSSVREKMGDLWPVKVSFFTLALLFISFHISFHYFLWIAPFILILGCNLKSRIMIFYALAIVSLAISSLAGKGMWLGLFSPVYPEFFMGLPGLDEVIKRVLPYTIIKQVATFVFIAALAWMSILVLRERDV